MSDYQARNKDELRKILDKYGPGALEQIKALILERAETFPDRNRAVKWMFRITDDGQVQLTDVQP